jgi:hypothetical protein
VQRSPGTVPLHRVRHIFGGGTSSRCPCIFPAVTGDGAPPLYSSHIRWRDVVPMSVHFSSGHRGRCPSIVFVTYSVEGHRPDVRAFFPAVTEDGVPPSCSSHIRWRDIVPMSVYFSSGHLGRCPSIVFVTYSVEGHRPDVRAFFQRSPRTVPLHRVRHIFGGGTSSRCPCIFPAVTEDGAPPSCSSHIRWRDVVPMSAHFSSGHRGRCPSIVFVTYSVEGHRLDVRVVHDSVVPLKRVELSLVWPILGGAR